MNTCIAYAHFVAGRHSEARLWAERALQEKPDVFLAISIIAASCALTGQITEAESAMARLRELEPNLRITNLADRHTAGRPQDFAIWAEGLRKAGLPE
jgi:hypothetical protein